MIDIHSNKSEASEGKQRIEAMADLKVAKPSTSNRKMITGIGGMLALMIYMRSFWNPEPVNAQSLAEAAGQDDEERPLICETPTQSEENNGSNSMRRPREIEDSSADVPQEGVARSGLPRTSGEPFVLTDYAPDDLPQSIVLQPVADTNDAPLVEGQPDMPMSPPATGGPGAGDDGDETEEEDKAENTSQPDLDPQPAGPCEDNCEKDDCNNEDHCDASAAKDQCDGSEADCDAAGCDESVCEDECHTCDDDACSDTPEVNVDRVFLAGTDQMDNLIGSDAAEEILGGAGDDDADGGNGDDAVMGGEGNDRIEGGGGADLIMGEAGDDALSGGAGNDLILGGNGSDILVGGEGDDRLVGGDGADAMWDDAGRDVLLGGLGDDTIYLTADGDADLVDGGAGVDTLDLSDAKDRTRIDVVSGLVEVDAGPADQMNGIERVVAGDAQDEFDFSGLAGSSADKDAPMFFQITEFGRGDTVRVSDAFALGFDEFADDALWSGPDAGSELEARMREVSPDSPDAVTNRLSFRSTSEERMVTRVIEFDLDGDGQTDFELTISVSSSEHSDLNGHA